MSSSTIQLLKKMRAQGYVLLRNTHHQLQDFIALSEQYGQDFLSVKPLDTDCHKRQTPRQIIGSHLGRTALPGYDSIFLNSGSGATFALPLHGELYYQKTDPPEALFFYCQTPPAEAGETLVCNGFTLFNALPPSLQHRLSSQKISYTRYSSKAVWQRDYATQDVDALLAFLAQHHIQAEVNSQGELKTVFTTSAVPQINGKHCFINNLIPFALREYQEPQATRSRVRFENGSPLSMDVLKTIMDKAQQHQEKIVWQAGDILILDNRFCMHGRNQLLEGPRTLYLRMAQRIHLEA